MAGDQMASTVKGPPYAALNAAQSQPDNVTTPLDARAYNAVIVDALPTASASTTTISVLGSPTGAPFLLEPDPQAQQVGVAAQKRFIVLNVSAFVAVRLSNPSGWTIILTPFIAASATNVSVTGASSVTLADGADANAGATTDAAVTSNTTGTLSSKLRGLVAYFAAAGSLTYGWLRVQPQPATWNLVGTSAANAAQTVTRAAGGAGVRTYLSSLVVSWSGGAAGAGARVDVLDGATVIHSDYVGAGSATQGSQALTLTQPLRGTANTALNVTVTAAGTGVTTRVSSHGTEGP